MPVEKTHCRDTRFRMGWIKLILASRVSRKLFIAHKENFVVVVLSGRTRGTECVYYVRGWITFYYWVLLSCTLCSRQTETFWNTSPHSIVLDRRGVGPPNHPFGTAYLPSARWQRQLLPTGWTIPLVAKSIFRSHWQRINPSDFARGPIHLSIVPKLLLEKIMKNNKLKYHQGYTILC